MLETVLALPILLVFIMMLLYFGVASTRLHDTAVLARSEALPGAARLRVAHEAASLDGSLSFTVNDMPYTAYGDSQEQMNDLYFGGRADEIDIDAASLATASTAMRDASDELAVETQALSNNALRIVDDMHLGAGGGGSLPSATRVMVHSNHNSLSAQSFGNAATRVDGNDEPVLMRNVVTGDMSVRLTGHSHDWRYQSGYRVNVLSMSQLSQAGFNTLRFSDTNHLRLVGAGTGSVVDLAGAHLVYRDDEYVDIWRPFGASVSVLGTARSIFLLPLDQALSNTPGPSEHNRLAQAIRSMYLNNHDYGGPTAFKPYPFRHVHPSSSTHHPGF